MVLIMNGMTVDSVELLSTRCCSDLLNVSGRILNSAHVPQYSDCTGETPQRGNYSLSHWKTISAQTWLIFLSQSVKNI